MAEQSPAYSWYPRDWFASESCHLLSLEAQGAYRNLLDHAWEKDGLPSDPRILQKLAGASDREWRYLGEDAHDCPMCLTAGTVPGNDVEKGRAS